MTTLDEINQRIERWNAEIAAARSAIRHGQIADAKAHLAGNVSNEAETARNALRRLLDLRDGAALLAIQVELEEVEADIAKREPRVAVCSRSSRDSALIPGSPLRAGPSSSASRLDVLDSRRRPATCGVEKRQPGVNSDPSLPARHRRVARLLRRLVTLHFMGRACEIALMSARRSSFVFAFLTLFAAALAALFPVMSFCFLPHPRPG